MYKIHDAQDSFEFTYFHHFVFKKKHPTTWKMNKHTACAMVKSSHRHCDVEKLLVKERFFLLVHVIILHASARSSSINKIVQGGTVKLGTEMNAASINCPVKHATMIQ